MTNDKTALLLRTIARRTNEGRIPWTQTSTENAFIVSFPNSSIRIVRESGYDDDAFEEYTIYNIEVLNLDGQIVETIRPVDVHQQIPNAWGFTEALFGKARDIALQVDKTIEKLFMDLGGPIDDELPPAQ